MKKQILATIVAGILSLSSLAALAGCGESGDNTEPEIKGVKDTLTVESGTQIDVLEGVTATDKEDGVLTDKIVVTSLPALTFTDGKATPTKSGTYELTYSVTDKGNLTAEAYSTLTVTRHAGEPETLYKFNFNNDTQQESHGWESSVGEKATATAALKEGSYVFDITNPGEKDDNITLIKNMELEPADYKIKVWAKSTKDTYIHVIAEDAGLESWQGLGGTYNGKVGATIGAVEANFTLAETKSTDLRIHLGKITPNPDNAADTTPTDFKVTIVKIELYKTTGTETKKPVYTENFANYANDKYIVGVGDNAAMTATTENGAAKFNITAYAAGQDDYLIKAALPLTGVSSLDAEKKYYVSFKATATNAQAFNVTIEDNIQEWQKRANFQSVDVGAGETKNVEFSFVPEKDGTADWVIRFYLGKHAAGVTSNVITIDDLVFGTLEGDRMTEKTNDRFIAYGGGSQNEANPAYIWDTFNGTDGSEEKGVGTIWTDGGSLFYRIDQGAAVDWHNKLVFGYTANPLKLPAHCYFTVKFTAKASKAVSCPMFLNNLGNWAPRVNEKVEFTTEFKTYEFTTTETLVLEMDFELLFQFGSDDLMSKGEVTIEFKDFEILKSVVS